MGGIRTFVLVFAVLFGMFPGCKKDKPISRGTVGPAIPGIPGQNPERPVIPDTPFHTVTPKKISVGKVSGGFYESLPPGYDTSTSLFPLLIFLHGGGELGDGNNDLPLVLKNAIPRMLDRKTFPKHYPFIIITPQFTKRPTAADVHDVVTYVLKNYKVNTRKVYMVGLSMGGGATWEYSTQYGSNLAAIIPICGASWANAEVGNKIAATGVAAWAFHNMDDSAVTYRSTTRYAEFINNAKPLIPVKVTLWPTGGHNAWSKACDPDYKEDGKNIYDWMLQYAR